VLFVGARGGYKNFAGLVESFAAAVSLRRDFEILCFGGGAFSDRESTLLDSLGIAGVVRHVGGGDEVLSGLLSTARVLVYPSLYEGFGIPLLEAMVAGCPVACSKSASLPEVAGDAAEYFDPSDFGEIQKALETVLGNSARREELIVKGRMRVKEFTWQRCAARTGEIYRGLL
jgi:glycosyltransferase involved in cell wall biosynthesis